MEEAVAFVPTMGNLHAGHHRLVERARTFAPRVVVSIFVNPTQFGPNEDYLRYPRTLAADLAGLASLGVDLVYVPEVADLYPLGVDQATRIEVPGLSEILCGASRPGHFAGVASVVLRLFFAIQPVVALFGEKDYQQCAVIRRLVSDLRLPVAIERVPTVRDTDGLALSSRNQYLSAEERKRAPELYRTLETLALALDAGRRDFPVLEQEALMRLERSGLVPDYVAVRAEETLAGPDPAARGALYRILGAARLGTTRLIDNIGWPAA
ncbi:Pantoate-beta-alanine ligase [mine drainage metagenome]|uniref:pantoate--beta-alanine ligase (AMP-forming) n=3 Tax=mine drainage metagenome TaxID=410659 RepID=T0ZF77_9ZZZZ